MKNIPRIAGILAAIFLVAAGGSMLSMRWFGRASSMEHGNAHGWIHSQLDLTEEQQRQLKPLESKYHDECERLEQRMRRGNGELARAILEDGKESDRVRQSIREIHDAMGEMQILTVNHVFEMKGILTSAQYDKLLRLTADALEHLDSGHVGE